MQCQLKTSSMVSSNGSNVLISVCMAFKKNYFKIKLICIKVDKDIFFFVVFFLNIFSFFT